MVKYIVKVLLTFLHRRLPNPISLTQLIRNSISKGNCQRKHCLPNESSLSSSKLRSRFLGRDNIFVAKWLRAPPPLLPCQREEYSRKVDKSKVNRGFRILFYLSVCASAHMEERCDGLLCRRPSIYSSLSSEDEDARYRNSMS
jgi:hypothetical protein